MTREQIISRFPRASRSFIEANADDSGVRSVQSKCPEGKALVKVLCGEKKGIHGPTKRHLLHFRIFSTRPLDSSNYELKYLEDGLVVAGLIPGDAWNQVEIHVASEKVHQKSEERTEIVIEEIQTMKENCPCQHIG